MDIISTKGVAAALGVSEATVKRWADAGMLRCFRTRGGHRKFRMRDVKAFLEDENPPQARPAESATMPVANAELRTDPEEARTLALAGDVDGLVTLVANQHARGVSLALIFDHVIAPAMAEIGEGWAKGSVSVAQEHVATNAVGEMLARVKPLVEATPRPDRGRAVCACVGDEQHDLAVRMVALILTEQGYHTATVGAGVPAGDLARMLVAEQPALVALSASILSKVESLRGDLAILASAATASRTRLVVGGGGFAKLPNLPGVARRHERLTDLVEAAQAPSETAEGPRPSDVAPPAPSGSEASDVEEAQKAAG